MHCHYKRAIKEGASQEEFAESIAIAIAISAGSKKAKYIPVIKALETNK
jgi:alkylhydroperoxidase/carboxymuconolactone decarboxylase family protein YurZ